MELVSQKKAGFKFKRTLRVITAVGLSLAAGLAFADKDLGSVAKTVNENLVNVAVLIQYGAYVAGLGFAIASMLKFKAHKDNPQQVTLGTPIAFLFIAAGLMFLPSVMKSAGGTLFSDDKKSADEAYEG